MGEIVPYENLKYSGMISFIQLKLFLELCLDIVWSAQTKQNQNNKHTKLTDKTPVFLELNFNGHVDNK